MARRNIDRNELVDRARPLASARLLATKLVEWQQRAEGQAEVHHMQRISILAEALVHAIAVSVDLYDACHGGGFRGAKERTQDRLLLVVKAGETEFRTAVGAVLHRTVPAFDTETAEIFLDDFTSSDLRTADLDGVDLTGVRWAEHGTLWPTNVDIDALKARSTETPQGSVIWIVQSGTAPINGLVLQQV